MPNLRGWEALIIILLIVVLLFGAKKLPETARGLGRSLRIFKAETAGVVETPGNDRPRASVKHCIVLAVPSSAHAPAHLSTQWLFGSVKNR